MNDEFKLEFQRRLQSLYDDLSYYYLTGKVGNVLPSLAKCVTYLWCNSPFKKRRK